MEKQNQKASLKRKHSEFKKNKVFKSGNVPNKKFKTKIKKNEQDPGNVNNSTSDPIQEQTITVLEKPVQNSDKSNFKQLKKKERKQLRKKNLNNYDLIMKCKYIWEDLRRHDCDKEKQAELCKELFNLVQGKVKQIIFAHDASRVLECLIALGSEQQKKEIFEEVKDSVVELAKSKYSKFFVQKLLKYGSKEQRNFIISSFSGHVQKLIKHSVASDVLEYAFIEFSNSTQKSSLLKELYGPLFKDEVFCVQDLLTSEPQRRDFILRCMKDCILAVVDKAVIRHSLIHRILRDYFSHADQQLKSDMIEALHDSCTSILHTKDGARVVCNCFWFGTAKDRKVIIKSFSNHVTKICQEEYGHLTLLALFDVTDDTKLVSTVILKQIKKNLHEIAMNAYGRKVLHYLLSPRNPTHFHPDIIKVLELGDNNPHSKKSKDVRQRELCEDISSSLLKYITENMNELLSINATSLLILDVLIHTKDDLTDAYEAIGHLVNEPFTDDHIINQTAGHLMLKRLISNDKVRAENHFSPLFSEVLLGMVSSETLQSWISSNRGAFTLCSLLETNLPEIVQQVNSALTPVKNEILQKQFKGTEILLNKLK